MIRSLTISNYRTFRNPVTLPLQPVTVLVGPNNVGKSNVLALLSGLGRNQGLMSSLPTDRLDRTKPLILEVQTAHRHYRGELMPGRFVEILDKGLRSDNSASRLSAPPHSTEWSEWPSQVSVYRLDPRLLREPAKVGSQSSLGPDGRGLPAVLDRLRDRDYDRFLSLQAELCACISEIEAITFQPSDGQKSIAFKEEGRLVPAEQASDGTLLFLAMLTIAYTQQPSLVCFEEPERGFHPRRIAEVVAAITSLAYPQGDRKPTQVILTTHSVVVLDQFRDTPESVLILDRDADGTRVTPLPEVPGIKEHLLTDSLGDLWYMGVLGGTPAARDDEKAESKA